MNESKYLEFKVAVSDTFLKTVSAFANFNTGKIIFGIDDEGNIIGIGNLEKTRLDIENKINDSINPKPDFELSVDQKNNLVILTVEEGDYKPYLYKGKAYRRSDTSTVEVDQTELKRLVLEGENLSFEELPYKNQDLSFDYLLTALDNKLNLEAPSKDTLKTLGLLNSKNEYNNAAGLLADKNTFPGIDIIKFASSINDIQDHRSIKNVSILEQLDFAENVFDLYYKVEEIRGMTREEKYLIPLEAFRETVANALVHRTWDISSHIRIAMFDEHIEVYSPGGLPLGLTEEEYGNGYVSYLRNPIIANVFFRLGIIEKFGTGIRRIKESYRNIKHKPIFKAQDNSIITILPTVNKRLDLSLDEGKIVRKLENGAILSSSELASATGFGKDKVLTLLNSLIDKGYVKKQGRGRGTKYKIIS